MCETCSSSLSAAQVQEKIVYGVILECKSSVKLETPDSSKVKSRKGDLYNLYRIQSSDFDGNKKGTMKETEQTLDIWR